MDSDKENDAALDALFAAGTAKRPEASEAFLARLAADAETMSEPAPRPAPPRPSFLTGLKGLFAASGLSGAAALGVWIGFVMPDLVTTVSPLTEEVAGLSAFLPGVDLAVLSE